MMRMAKTVAPLMALLLIVVLTFGQEAWARAGGGGSAGGRGSRGMSSPSRSYTAPSAPSRQQPAPPAAPAPAPQPGGGFLRGVGGGILGGLLGGLLFSSFGFGGFGRGFGLLDIVLLAVIGYLVYRFVSQRRQSQAVEERPEPAALPEPERITDVELERGLAYIRQMDPSFDEARFREEAGDIFFKVQAAWTNRDLSPVRSFLTAQVATELEPQLERLRQEAKINRLENIAIRAVEIIEAWQEVGQDYITARFSASLLDYTVDEATGRVVEGSRTEPVKFEEYWTFTRPVGPNPWRLSAIVQPALA